MLIIAYWISSLFIIYLILIQKKFDRTTIFGIGLLIYGLPLFLGYTTFQTSNEGNGEYYFQQLDYRLYLIFFMAHLTFYIAYIFTIKLKFKAKNSEPNILLFYCGVILNLIYLVLFIITTGIDVFTIIRKVERIEHYTIFYDLTIITSITLLIYYALNPHKKFKKILIIPIGILLLDLYFGDRTVIAMGFISLILIYFEKSSKQIQLKSKLKITFAGVFLLVGLLIIKPINNAIKRDMFSWDLLPQYIKSSFIGSEPFVITGVLNETIIKGVTVPENYFFETIFQHLPFYQLLTGNSRSTFNTYTQGQLFSQVEYGIASTSFGQLYVAGGIIALILFLVFILTVIKMPIPKSSYGKILFYYIVPYVLVYFHRNDWNQFINYIKYFVIASIGVMILYSYLFMILNAVKRRKA